ncbi:hypothetical protein [Rhodanobacter sp. A1T4]|uniref:hypothetical protein n=1 Tax=Rhodanobacter sp. A1T4 TaxID=2723087 RepID=UPI00160FC4DF|nr:hypothetical protein [Rhodanobacter sp. A1T4]MBB6246365.1 hypothetical protein [Rhodanobacter sp. A1T4]
MIESAVVEHVFYIPKDAPLRAAASACFPYATPPTATDAALRFPQGGRRVRVTITVEELP